MRPAGSLYSERRDEMSRRAVRWRSAAPERSDSWLALLSDFYRLRHVFDNRLPELTFCLPMRQIELDFFCPDRKTRHRYDNRSIRSTPTVAKDDRRMP